MTGHWHAFLRSDVCRFIQALPKKRRDQVIAFVEQLEQNPYLRHEVTEAGASGREYRVKLLPGFAISYWLDHFAKEVQIVRIKKIRI